MTKEEAKKILTEYTKACREDDMFALEQFTYEEVIEAMDIGAEAISMLSVSSDLEEAAKECNSNLQLQEYFIKGGMWQKEQMMKGAVEGELFDFWDIKEVEHCIASIDLATTLGFNDGDKVRVIVLPKEDWLWKKFLNSWHFWDLYFPLLEYSSVRI